MQSLGRITSGLQAAQTGLYTVGHNMANAATEGYSRQRANFGDAAYSTIGFNGTGNLKVGLGTGTLSTVQIRDEFLDKTYRQASTKLGYHSTKYAAVNEIENIIGELYGDARLSRNIDEMWKSLQELMTHPEGIETRSMFVQSAINFVSIVNEIGDGLYNYQKNLNEQVIESVNRINQITTQIEDLNKKIVIAEGTGDNANDYRDTRNLLVDELSLYGELHVNEEHDGRLTILMEGKDLVANGSAKLLGLRYTSDAYPFVEPIFNQSYATDGKILKPSDDARPLFNNLVSQNMSGQYDNDNGSLKALMVARGPAPANYTSDSGDVKNFTIPKFQRELDILVNKIVTMINDTLAPKDHDPSKAPSDLEDEQFVELFTRIHRDRYDSSDNYIEEDPSDPYSLYSMGNIKINPKVLNNFNKLCLSATGDTGDTSVVENLLDKWNGTADNNYLPHFELASTKLSFTDYYAELVTNLGNEGKTSKVYVDAQNQIVIDADNARSSLSGVSLDEELSEMMKFQHAYNGAAKMVNVIDGMLDVIVNRLKA